MLRLYDTLISGNGYKVRLLLTQLGLPFERVEMDIFKGETRTPAFLALNPNGRIPTAAFRPCGSRMAAIWPNPTPSSVTWPRTLIFGPPTARRGPRLSSGCSSSSTATSPISPCCASGPICPN
jgi:hypothetical protein